MREIHYMPHTVTQNLPPSSLLGLRLFCLFHPRDCPLPRFSRCEPFHVFDTRGVALLCQSLAYIFEHACLQTKSHHEISRRQILAAKEIASGCFELLFDERQVGCEFQYEEFLVHHTSKKAGERTDEEWRSGA